jgi:RNA recognition motif-containing protein
MKIHVSNLAADVTVEDVRNAFASFGEVVAVTLEMAGGKFKGSAIVEMADEFAVQRAISSLKGRNLKGKPLKISGKGPAAGGTGGPRRHAGDRKGGARGGKRS